LRNLPLSSGGCLIEQLQISVAGLARGANCQLYDSSVSRDGDQPAICGLDSDASPPLQFRAMVPSLSLESVNKSNSEVDTVATTVLQIAASCRFLPETSAPVVARVMFRYRGASTATHAIWRTSELKIRITPTRGPQVSCIQFRPDLIAESFFGDLRKSSPNPTKLCAARPGSLDTWPGLDEVGVHGGDLVCSERVVAVVTITNHSENDVLLSRSSIEGGVASTAEKLILALKPGTAAKLPINLTRIRRSNGSEQLILPTLLREIASQTQLRWKTNTETGREFSSSGAVQIHPESLGKSRRSIFSHFLESPLGISFSVDKAAPDSRSTGLGVPLELTLEASLSKWVAPSVARECHAHLEFVCLRVDSKETSTSTTDFVWGGKRRSTASLSDANLFHMAKVAFVRPGDFVVSACVRIYRKEQALSDIMPETWWAPVAQQIRVEGPILSPQ
jgi:hypothetical protein